MAAPGETSKEVRTHEKSYALFTTMMKWGTILSVMIAFVVILLIRN